MFPSIFLTNHSGNLFFNINPQPETEYLKKDQQEANNFITFTISLLEKAALSPGASGTGKTKCGSKMLVCYHTKILNLIEKI